MKDGFHLEVSVGEGVDGEFKSALESGAIGA